MYIFRGKIPVKVDIFFLLLIGLLGWINTNTVQGTLVAGVVMFISVLVHEYGHALTAVAFGQKADIELYGLGGMTRRRGPPISLWKEFLIVFNGPLAGLGLFLLSFQISKLFGNQIQGLWALALYFSIYVNLFWTIINLLPVQPLDGGHLLRIILEAVFGIRGIKISWFISMVLAAGLGLYFFKIGALLIGVIFLIFTFEGYRNWRIIMSLTDHDRNAGMQKRFQEAEDTIRTGNYSLALDILEEIRRDTKKGVIYSAATEYAAKILAEQGRYEDAYNLINPIKKQLSPESLSLLQELAFKLEYWEEAIDLGIKSYQNFPNYHTAVIIAMCHSILGEVKPAIGWLQTALTQGLPNITEILKKREFDHIRNDPQFQSLIEQSSK